MNKEFIRYKNKPSAWCKRRVGTRLHTYEIVYEKNTTLKQWDHRFGMLRCTNCNKPKHANGIELDREWKKKYEGKGMQILN